MFKSVTPQVDFPKLERDLLKEWYEKGIVEKYLHKNDSSEKKFSFLDGPITANNPMGVHHAWGRTYKDLWQRYFNMRGFRQRFQNGFDCQGLWVEVEVEKELGIRNKKDIENLVPNDKTASIAKFVELCRERVLKFSLIQTEQSKRLGYFMDWDNSYFTMSDENNYMIWYFLKTCYERGWIYKGRDSVPWCPRCETAISEHEMLTEDYKELTHETVFLKLPITTKGFENTYLLIWTTTPWTIPANVAVGVNTKYLYAIWENEATKEKVIIIDKDQDGKAPTRLLKGKEIPVYEYIFKNVIIEGEFKKIKEIQGKELVGLTYQAPFDYLPRVQKAREENPKAFHTVIDASEVVVSNEGTGLLHVATGAGKEDFALGKKEHLPIISVIADDASYFDGMDEFSGKNAKKHPELIIDFLKTNSEGKYLLKTMPYTHRYPACWRCKTELVWKVTDEWYIAMDRPSSKLERSTLREQMKETAKMINWIPDFGLDRELDWLTNMHDWLISKKNRYWGLALPIFECQSCGKFEVIGSKEELKEKTVFGWEEFEGHSPHKPYIDKIKIRCECGEEVSRVDDVGNVWLDAGIVPFSTYINPDTGKLSYTTDKKYWKEWFPADFITESFPGQFKNWFYSLIAMSTVLEGRNSFKTVLGFASVLGEDGRPMHKSWGNAIEFNEGADKIGVDVIRWMFVRQEPEQNILFGYKKADETRRQFHLMLWNIYNFFVTYANLDKWEISNGRSAIRDQSVLDQWIISRLNGIVEAVSISLEKYKAKEATEAIEKFVKDLSLWYVRRSRDRVGPTADQTEDKNACYETLYTVLVTLSKLLTPFTPFLAEEIYRNLTGEESVHLANWPLADKKLINKGLEQQMDLVRKIVELGHAKRKESGIRVKQPLRKIQISNIKDQIEDKLKNLIKEELNIKEVETKKGDGELAVTLDTAITDELAKEGQARDIVRKIQEERKKLGTKLDEKVNIILEDWPKEYEEYIIKNALVGSLSKGESFKVERV